MSSLVLKSASQEANPRIATGAEAARLAELVNTNCVSIPGTAIEACQYYRGESGDWKMGTPSCSLLKWTKVIDTGPSNYSFVE